MLLVDIKNYLTELIDISCGPIFWLFLWEITIFWRFFQIMNEFQGSYAATAAGIMLTDLLGQKRTQFAE